MEANIKIIDKMLEEYGVEASKQAKQALINFSVLFGQKFVRKCAQGRSFSKKLTNQQIRHAYELSKGLHTVEYQSELEERKNQAIAKINTTKLIKQQQDQERGQNTARSVMTVNFYHTDIYHMTIGKEHQLTFQNKSQNE